MKLDNYLDKLKSIWPYICYLIVVVVTVYCHRYFTRCSDISDSTKDIIDIVSKFILILVFAIIAVVELIRIKKGEE